jgi:hypothetical protein
MSAMNERGAASSLRGYDPKRAGTTCVMHVPEHFRAPNNIIKYDSKTNPDVWLHDYQLACRADDDLFIIQVLPIYLADMARARLDHLP